MTELVTVRRTAALAAAIAILFPFLLAAALSTSRVGANALGKFTATAWPEADRLFRSDPLWLGGDAAYSVDLGHGRVLWLFGDSFIASKPGETRRESTFVHNSIAIETGYDPAHASMKFYWPIKDGRPSEFVPNEGEVWLWPEDGIRIGKKLLLFFVRVHSENSKNSLGFDLVGWTAFLVENPDAAPSAWVVHRVDTPENPWRILIGSAAYRRRGFVYSFGSGDHGDFLVRWPVAEIERGSLCSLKWWCGSRRGWIEQDRLRQPPALVIPDGSNEFTVQWSRKLTEFTTAESVGFGATDIGIRWADRLEGPWSKPLKVYHPPESNRPDAFVYAGKGHPELTGADLVITYVANTSRDEILARDMSIYRPRFVRLNLSKGWLRPR